MSASLPPDRMVCLPCYRCGRDQFIITDAAGQPVAYDGAGFATGGLSLEASIDRLFNTECDDCERIKALDAPFIIERYWQGRLFSVFEHGIANQC